MMLQTTNHPFTFTPVFDVFNNTTTTAYAEETPQGDFISRAQFDLILKCTLPFRFAICVVGIVGNLVNIRTFLRMGLEDTVTIAFFNLAVSDLLILIAALTSVASFTCAVLEENKLTQPGFPPRYIYTYCVVIGRIFGDVTIYMTTFLAIQRCLCVVKPFHFKGMFTRRRTFVFVSAIWGYCLICGGIHLSQYQIRKIFMPNSTSTAIFVMILRPSFQFNAIFLRLVNGVIFNEVSQAIVLVCVLVMARALKTTAQFRLSNAKSNVSIAAQKSSGDLMNTDGVKSDKMASPSKTKSSLSSSKERQAIVQVAIVSAIFLVSNMPYLCMAVSSLIEPGLGPGRKYATTFSAMFYARWAIENINSSVNVFIYYKYNTKFKEVCFRRKQ